MISDWPDLVLTSLLAGKGATISGLERKPESRRESAASGGLESHTREGVSA